MKHTRSWTRRTALVGVAAIAAAGAIATAAPSANAGHEPTFTVIATGLNNPRGLAVAGNQALYIAEAGLGAGNEATGSVAGIGTTGGLSVVWSPRSNRSVQQRLISGIASAAEVEGGDFPDAIGLDGLSFSGGKLYGILGAAEVNGTNLGHLVQFECVGPNRPAHKQCVPLTPGGAKTLADVGHFSLGWTSDHLGDEGGPDEIDSDPYGVLVTGNKRYVVDAGANTLNEVGLDGSVKVLAFFGPGIVSDSVPTCVTKGPDGALYVGTLNLLDFFVLGLGHASIWRVDPKHPGAATQWATGLNTITGCTADGRGNIDVVEMFTGQVVRVPFKHPGTGRQVLTDDSLVLPNGIAVAQDGTIYVSTFSTAPTARAGAVVRIDL